MKTLYIDFETYDPYITRGLGSGWVYGVNVTTSDFRVLGAALASDQDEPTYITDFTKLGAIVASHDRLVMHNATYDLGCLRYLGVDFSHCEIHDTMIMARLYAPTAESYSLSALSDTYLHMDKDVDSLADAAWTIGLCKGSTRPSNSILLRHAYQNMDKLQLAAPDVVAKYAIRDISCTQELHRKFLEAEEHLDYGYWCRIPQMLVDMRQEGVLVDIAKAKRIMKEWAPILEERTQKVYDIAGYEFNINSSAQLAEVCDGLGINYGLTDKGNPQLSKDVLTEIDHPLCEAILSMRSLQKVLRDFIGKIIDIQEFTCPDGGDYGKLYPELRAMNARTGRFTCEGPNIQQIPGRDPVLGPLCRSLFIAPEGKSFHALDYSNQEGRLQVHYAAKLGCEGVAELVQKYRDNPNFDAHGYVAELMGVDRTEAKTINLGLSYGMGVQKLAKALKYDTAGQAKRMRDKYYEAAPYLKQLTDKCKEVITNRGYLMSLGRRRIASDPAIMKNGTVISFEYKAINKLIQGSAADQIMMAMLDAYEKGILLSFCVHDECCLVGTEEEARHLKQIMETVVELEVPVVVEAGTGQSWAEAK